MPVHAFPAKLSPNRVIVSPPAEIRAAPFVVVAMLTESYAGFLDRFVEACTRYGLPYAVHVLPAVHRSISPKGVSDLAFTKANFLYGMLDSYAKHVLYLDIDCVIREEPALIAQMVRQGRDFSVYNWLVDAPNDTYRPIDIANLPPDLQREDCTERFYSYSHSIDYWSADQLVCSGAVQLYGNTPAARGLLQRWHETIATFPGTRDDHCLDFAFNNRSDFDPMLDCEWLPKSYARYRWWIYERPVIDHPDIPYEGTAFVQIQDPGGRLRVHHENVSPVSAQPVFPRDCVIDVRQKVLLRWDGQRFVEVERVTRDLWV